MVLLVPQREVDFELCVEGRRLVVRLLVLDVESLVVLLVRAESLVVDSLCAARFVRFVLRGRICGLCCTGLHFVVFIRHPRVEHFVRSLAVLRFARSFTYLIVY